MTFVKKHPEYILFFLFAIIGTCTASAYGMTWDELYQRTMGEVLYNYVFKNDGYYLVSPDRDHGPLFEFVLVLIEKIGNMTSSRSLYIMRHTVTHLFFLISALCFYKLIFLLYNKRSLAILGFLFLVITPTIYGHSFFNSKDVPFLSLFIICFYQFALAFKDKKWYQFIWLGLFSCLLMNIRIMGILFVVFVLFFLLLDLYSFRKEKGSVKKHLLFLCLFTMATVLFTILIWPLLWHNPLQNFLYVFKSLSKFGWGGVMLFNGNMISSENLTWTYIPTWFCINTPLIYLLLGFSGILLFIIQQLKALKSFNLQAIDKNNVLYLLSFFAPVLAIIILNSVVFDSWRHLFYIYPSFILLAIYFMNFSMERSYKWIVSALAGISIAMTAFFMMSNFPFSHVYFNELVSLHKGEYLKQHYEMDYWGVSYNKSLEYIVSVDNRDTITVFAQNSPGIDNANMLPDTQKKHLVFVDALEKADYFITNYRGHPNGYEEPNIIELKSFSVLGNKINSVFRVKK
ncbi:MAG: glycosyltransferase family 39 protein [Bacteroidota bacterium]